MGGAGDGGIPPLIDGLPIIGPLIEEIEERREKRLLEEVILPPTIQTFSLTKENLDKFADEVIRLFGADIFASYTKRDGERIWRPQWQSLKLEGTGISIKEGELSLNFYTTGRRAPASYTLDLNLEPKFAFLPNKTNFMPRGLYVSQGNNLENPWLRRLEVAYVAKPAQK